MMHQTYLLATVLLLVACVVDSFSMRPSRANGRPSISRTSSRLEGTAWGVVPTVSVAKRSLPVLFLSSESDGDSSTSSPSKRRQRKRRKRKVEEPSVVESTTPEPPVAATPPAAAPAQPTPVAAVAPPRTDEVVTMQVQDIRDVVAGRTTTGEPSATSPPKPSSAGREPTSGGLGGGIGDSFKQLLEDAKDMADSDSKSSGRALAADSDDDDEEEGGLDIPKTIRGALSALVTADFFVVCILLLWFLAGIFSSYVLKDDGVQIAFNGIFEPVVQPALGILMIGSIASAVWKDEEVD